MGTNRQRLTVMSMLLLAALLVAACAPAAVPATPTATKPTAAAAPATPTTAPAPPAAVPATPTSAAPPPATKAPATVATPAPAAPKTLDKVRFGTVGGTSESTVYYGMEKGWFREQGVEIELVPFMGSPSDQLPALATSEVDVGNNPVMAGFFNAVARGVAVKVVATGGMLTKGVDNPAWAIRKDLVGQVKDYADLKGKKVAVSTGGTIGEVALALALEKAGLPAGAAQVVNMGFGDQLAAFANKSIDVGYLVDPFLTTGTKQGVLEVWKGVSDVLPGYQMGLFLASPRFTTEKRDLAKRFMVAYIRGARMYADTFFKNKGDRAGMIAALTKYGAVKDPAVYEGIRFIYHSPEGVTDGKALAEQMEAYVKLGYVQTKPQVEAMIDNELAQYANQVLGKYE